MAHNAVPESHGSPSLASLALVFLVKSTTNYGGAQSAAIYREVVRRRRWLSEDEFMGFRAIAQLAPGPNSPNLAVLIGNRVRGPLGAAVAFVAATVPGVAIILVLGMLAISIHRPMVRGALAGCAAASVGAALANAIELTVRDRRWLALLIIATVAVCVVVLHVSLVMTLAMFVPLSIALSWRGR